MHGPRFLHVIHFNDVYNIEASKNEPVGGAAKFAHQVKSLQHLNPLVLFGGDAFNPSLMSTVTGGKQMVPILNALGVKAAVVGNHDLDFGLNHFEELAAECSFPWLLANVLDKKTGQPLAKAQRTIMIEWEGVSIGVLGLAEGEWVDTLSAVEPEDVEYLDFVTEGQRLAQQLRADGAELVIALTHMRVPNDTKLAQQVPEIDIVAGGHDHHYEVELLEPNFNLMVKSGTDFRDLTLLTIEVPGKGAPAPSREEAAAAVAAAAANPHEGLEALAGSVEDGMALASGRATVKFQHLEIRSNVPDDPEIAKLVEDYSHIMGKKMDEVIGRSLVDLDGRFTTVRREESNLGNLCCDVFRKACNADAVIMNSGTFRSDVVHPAGTLTVRDLMSVLPMMDETVVVEANGQQLLDALENGVSCYPKLEGRFPQVSGISFSFDPSKPAGQRVVPGSVHVGRSPLQLQQRYRLATKAYLAEGKDGYTVLEGCPVLQDSEICPLLPTVMRHFFMILDVLNRLDQSSTNVASISRRWLEKAKQKAATDEGHQQQNGAPACKEPGPGQPMEGPCVKHPESGEYVAVPVVDGRIRCLAGTS